MTPRKHTADGEAGVPDRPEKIFVGPGCGRQPAKKPDRAVLSGHFGHDDVTRLLVDAKGAGSS